MKIGEEEFDRQFLPLDQREDFPKGNYILHPDDFILTTGQMFEGKPPESKTSFTFQGEKITNLGEFNNQTVELILSRKNQSLKLASQRLEQAVEFDPLFFPTRYNYGRVLQIQWHFAESKDQFARAALLVPKYYRTYFHIGLIFWRMGKYPESADYFKRAVPLQKLRSDAKTMLCILAHTKGYPSTYKKFIRDSYPDLPPINASICKAAGFYYMGNYQKSYTILKSIQIPKEEGFPTYTRLFHFYLADSSQKVQDLDLEIREYEKLLEHPFDPVYLEFSEKTILRKLEIAKYIKENQKKN